MHSYSSGISLDSSIPCKDFTVLCILITETITGQTAVTFKSLSRFIHEGSEKCRVVLSAQGFIHVSAIQFINLHCFLTVMFSY